MKKTATRNPMQAEISPETCTEFQMHRTQHPQFDQVKHKLVDFTEHRLQRLIDKAHDVQLRSALAELLQNYRRGNVAIAWRRGKPTWLNVTREK